MLQFVMLVLVSSTYRHLNLLLQVPVRVLTLPTHSIGGSDKNKDYRLKLLSNTVDSQSVRFMMQVNTDFTPYGELIYDFMILLMGWLWLRW